MRARASLAPVLVRWLNRAWLVLAWGLLAAPVLALLVSMASVPSSDWLSLALPLGGRGILLLRSVALSAGSSLLATAVGLLAALRLWRVPSQARTALTWGALAFAAIPPYIHALVWSHILGPAGWPAALWVQAAWFAPVALALCLAGLDGADPELFDAARLHVPPWKAFAVGVLPSCRPHLLASFSLCFAIGLLDFTVPSLYHMDVYALDVFAELGATETPGRVVWMSLPLVASASLASLLFWRSIRVVAAGRSQPARPRPAVRWPMALVVLQGLAALIALAWVGVPFVTLAVMTGSLGRWGAALANGSRELETTAWVAVWAAALAVLAARPWAGELARPGWRGVLAWTLLWIPWVLPPSLIGLGLIGVWNRSWFEPLMQSRGILVLASVERFAPSAALVLWAVARQRDPALLDAIRVHQRSAWHGWLHAGFGLERTGWLAAAALVLALSAGELGASLLVAPPGYATLTMRLYNYLHAGATRSVAGTCLTMWLLTLLAGLVAFAALRGRTLDRRPPSP